MRSLVIAVTLAILPLACAGPAPTPQVAPSPEPSLSASAFPPPSLSPLPSRSPLVPSPSPSPLPTPSPVVPTADALWEKVGEAIAEAGTLDVLVEQGFDAAHLRYEATASATVADGEIVFICAGGRAYEGASGGFSELPGRWSCGGSALVAGFRRNGQPIDAWNDTVPSDDGIRESTKLAPDGSWLWTYEATSDAYGGRVETAVEVDPATGRIRAAARTDPLGTTNYSFTYEAASPPIEAP